MRKRTAGVVAGLAMVLAGCGEKEASVLDRAFESEIRSAQLSVDVRATEGAARKELGRFTMSGPFQAAPTDTQLDRFDLRMRFRGHHGERLSARVISTGENVFIRYQGKTYEVGRALVASFEQQAARERKKGEQVEDLDDLERLGLDLRSWFPKSADEGASTAAGVPTTKITGQLDVSQMLEDFNVLLRKPAFRGQFEGQVAPRLGKKDIREADEMLSDPRMEVHVGRDDGKFRRIAATMRFEIPKEMRQGAAFGNLAFAMELRNVDRPVTIDAPTSGRPLGQLLRKLEGTDGGGKGGGAAEDAAELAPA